MTKTEMEMLRIVDKYCGNRNGCTGCVNAEAGLECEPLGEDLEKAVALIEQERSKNE